MQPLAVASGFTATFQQAQNVDQTIALVAGTSAGGTHSINCVIPANATSCTAQAGLSVAAGELLYILVQSGDATAIATSVGFAYELQPVTD